MTDHYKTFASRVAEICCHHYDNKLRKTGKPQTERDWTFMAAVVARFKDDRRDDLKVIAMGTGSKCLGRNKLSCNGDVIHDSHAEVIARRSFIRFLYSELGKVYSGAPSDYVLKQADGAKCRLHSGVTFHFYTSHVPCGDAAIFPMKDNEGQRVTENIGQVITSAGTDQIPSTHDDGGMKRPCDATIEKAAKVQKISSEIGKKVDMSNSEKSDMFEPRKKSDMLEPGKKSDKNSDVHRTGAKCVSGDAQDSGKSGAEYHVTGVLRTKPGRGDRTISMSCSDKLAAWGVTGIQGALLSLLLDSPVYIDTLIIGKCICSLDALKRALLDRTSDHTTHEMTILQDTSHTFSHARRSGSRPQPFAGSIIWYMDGGQPHQEASVQGRRQGIVATDWNRPKARNSVCKYELFSQFLQLMSKLSTEDRNLLNIKPKDHSYQSYKQCAENYQDSKKKLRTRTFKNWITTPEEYNLFTVDSRKS